MQAEVERAGVERDLTIAEVAFVAEQWQAANRFDHCAASIRPTSISPHGLSSTAPETSRPGVRVRAAESGDCFP